MARMLTSVSHPISPSSLQGGMLLSCTCNCMAHGHATLRTLSLPGSYPTSRLIVSLDGVVLSSFGFVSVVFSGSSSSQFVLA